MCGILYLHDPDHSTPALKMAELTFLGATSLQHRGQDGGGMAYTDGRTMWSGRFFDLVSGLFDSRGLLEAPEKAYRGELGAMARRKPYKAGFHLRYSTAGGSYELGNFQPHYLDTLSERVVYYSNGDIPGYDQERATLESANVDFQSRNDGELTLRKIVYIREQRRCSWLEAIQEFMLTTPGAYSGVLMTKHHTYLLRDPWGFRPFLVGRTNEGMIVAASETCALEILQAQFLFEVPRGAVIEIESDGHIITHNFPGSLPARSSHCIFCLDYFARPDSLVFLDGRTPDEVRQKGSYAHAFGWQLAVEHPVDADFCAPIPDSGNNAARGYAAQSGMRQAEVLLRNRAIPRTFIMTLEMRSLAVRLKYGVLRDILRKYPRVCLVDDSIVRATTLREVIAMLRRAGAKEAHVRISFPPIISPCYMGIAMPTRAELVASSRTVEQVREYIGADTLGYLSVEGLTTALKRRGDDICQYCTACFTGEYPIPVTVK